jgi:hypothetical protein
MSTAIFLAKFFSHAAFFGCCNCEGLAANSVSDASLTADQRQSLFY